MEVRDPIHGSISLSDAEVALIDSVPYQRLRSIKQLGFSEFSFPGATHNRYLHSIGVSHLAGLAFDQIFHHFVFQKPDNRKRLRQTVRLGAFLHDIGHGPLSHTTEEVMPKLADLNVQAYAAAKNAAHNPERQANHEDYTIKFITDSSLTDVLRANFSDIDPYAVACLIDRSLPSPTDFFMDGGRDLRPVLSQLISSEMDVDRMDYLERDAYFCGTNYGKVELEWLIANLASHTVNDKVYLALKRKAIYTFDDFLLARHHMHLMVYFHHKSIIYEEMLHRYLQSPDCTFRLPGDINEYVRCTDYALYEHLSKVKNPWARRIAERKPYRMLFELHSNESPARVEELKLELEDDGIPSIHASSQARLSKYHALVPQEKAHTIYVVDDYDRLGVPTALEKNTGIFEKYEEIRQIDRVYVPPEEFDRAVGVLTRRK